ncbi:MAG: redox-regulated ATPase YchF, partial [Ignavibacteriales bacterium]|nr:redox-regulated ATPase YchF [Ignavibacteriales bacterium]
KNYSLLTLKPMLIALNLDETQFDDEEIYAESVHKKKGGKNTKILSFFGKIEMEMSELSDSDSELFMNEYGIKESALHRLIRESYDLLGLQSFFTVGEDECRAWTITKGMTAQEAAGVIHSDFVNRFIRAEVVAYDDFIEYGGSFTRVKENGFWRLEGKDYIVKEGDILTIRHS